MGDKLIVCLRSLVHGGSGPCVCNAGVIIHLVGTGTACDYYASVYEWMGSDPLCRDFYLFLCIAAEPAEEGKELRLQSLSLSQIRDIRGLIRP